MTHYFELALTHTHRDFLISALRTLLVRTTDNYGLGPPKLSASGKTHRELIELLLLAPRVDLPLAAIDWEAAEEEAERRGCSLVDLFWDQALRPEPDYP
jgi:hypothetical protein